MKWKNDNIQIANIADSTYSLKYSRYFKGDFCTVD